MSLALGSRPIATAVDTAEPASELAVASVLFAAANPAWSPRQPLAWEEEEEEEDDDLIDDDDDLDLGDEDEDFLDDDEDDDDLEEEEELLEEE
jgi:hypothetical protein